MLHLAVSVEHRLVADGQTDKQRQLIHAPAIVKYDTLIANIQVRTVT